MILHTTDLNLAGKTYNLYQAIYIKEINIYFSAHDFTIKYFDPCQSSSYSSPEIPGLQLNFQGGTVDFKFDAF